MLAFLFSVALAGPDGSYLRTCTQVTATRRDLTATCQTVGGDWQRTRLRWWSDCTGDIANIDGTLACTASLPAGSYQLTCADIVLHGDTLTATCQTMRGDWQRTRLPQATSCHADLANIDGTLTCTE